MSSEREKIKRPGFPDRFIFRLCSNLFPVEIADDMARADLGAVTALRALVVIHDSEEVDDFDGLGGAFALALHAADAADLADLQDRGALVPAAAGGHDLLLLRDELDDVLRAGFHAGTAADAAFFQNSVCHTVNLLSIFAIGFE